MRSRLAPLLLGRSVAATAVIGAVLVATTAVAAAKPASSIDDVGWWSRTNQNAILGSALATDVSEEEMLVEGTPEGATALSAFRATLPPDSRQPVLTLKATSAVGGDTAMLLACQAGSGWTGAEGGEWSAKPSPDCAESVQGVPEGDTWTFALGPLQFEDQLNVVLVPGLDANSGAGSTFRIVLERPTASSIQVSESNVEPDFEVPDFDSSDFGSEESGSGGSSDEGGSFGPPSGTSSPAFSPPSPVTSDELASQPAQAALPADEQGRTATAPALNSSNALPPAPLRAASGSDGGDGRLLGVLVALGAAALLFWTTQLQVPGRQTLSRFAMAAGGGGAHAAAGPVDLAERIPEEKRMGGLGRFRRARDTPARRLGT